MPIALLTSAEFRRSSIVVKSTLNSCSTQIFIYQN